MDGFSQVLHPQTMSVLTLSRKFQKLGFLLALITLWMFKHDIVTLLFLSFSGVFFVGLEQSVCLIGSSSSLNESLSWETFVMLDRSEMLHDGLLQLDSGMSLLTIEDFDDMLQSVSAKTVSNSPEDRLGTPQLKHVKGSSDFVRG